MSPVIGMRMLVMLCFCMSVSGLMALVRHGHVMVLMPGHLVHGVLVMSGMHIGLGRVGCFLCGRRLVMMFHLRHICRLRS